MKFDHGKRAAILADRDERPLSTEVKNARQSVGIVDEMAVVGRAEHLEVEIQLEVVLRGVRRHFGGSP